MFTINPGVTINPGITITAAHAPTGLNSADASTSAWAIKQAYPASPDGLYWIQNASINGGNAFQVYCDMTTLGGGWTLILQNNYNDWSFGNCLLRNETTPPSSLVSEGTYGANGTNNYSIIAWADYIKRSASGFDYMFDAYARGRNGGAWTANSAYSFVDQVDPIAYGTLGSSGYFGPTNVVTGSDGFHQNITEIQLFPAGTSMDNFTWTYEDSGIEHRMPWFAEDPNSVGSFFVGGAMITTTHDDNGSWWGTLISGPGWAPAPWISTTNLMPAPQVIWYWVR